MWQQLAFVEKKPVFSVKNPVIPVAPNGKMTDQYISIDHQYVHILVFFACTRE